MFCISLSSLVFLIPSFTPSNLIFTKAIANSRAYRMATEVSSSLSSSVTCGDIISPLASSTNNGAVFSSSSYFSAIDFLTICHRLKTTKRAGWVGYVKSLESIADHMYRMGLMGLIMADIPGIDRDKLRDLFLLVLIILFIMKMSKGRIWKSFSIQLLTELRKFWAAEIASRREK